jgi:hypothetical protein
MCFASTDFVVADSLSITPTVGTMLGFLVIAVIALVRGDVVSGKFHKDVCDRITASKDQTIADLKAAFAEQLRVANTDKAEFKSITWQAMGVTRGSVDVLKEQVQVQRLGGGSV